MAGGMINRVLVAVGLRRPAIKEEEELAYWQDRKRIEGEFHNSHYREFQTTHFGFTDDDMRGKRLLDVGCGPRGSLEWADMAGERIGLDPLADEYLKLGADRHKMKYIAAPSEKMPFEAGHFDFVFSFNSLDHVADVDATIAEIKRVVRPGGFFLLLTDVNHAPTPCEPQTFDWDIQDRFLPEFELLESRRYEKNTTTGMYNGIRANEFFDQSNTARRAGTLSAKFRRR